MKSTDPQTSSESQVDLQTAFDLMAQVLHAVESGDLSARVLVSDPQNEPIGALAACINTMTTYLAERRDETHSFQQQLEGQIETIDKQRIAIRELSTPIIEVWSGVLCAPIVGVLDSARAAEMTSALLNTVVDKKARLAIIDITGIEAMDTQATDHFLRMARAVRLLGADCALSGVHPNVARTIVHMGIDLAGIASHRTLRDVLSHHVRNSSQRRRPPQGERHA